MCRIIQNSREEVVVATTIVINIETKTSTEATNKDSNGAVATLTNSMERMACGTMTLPPRSLNWAE